MRANLTRILLQAAACLALFAVPAFGQTDVLLPMPRQQFFDNNGVPLAGGLVFTYLAGTSTPEPTYPSSLGGSPNSNPIVLDSSGSAFIWLLPGVSYRFVVESAASQLEWTADNVLLGVPNGAGGNPTQVQFNCGGALCGDPGMTYTLATQTFGAVNLTVTNNASVLGALAGSVTNGVCVVSPTGAFTTIQACYNQLPSQGGSIWLTPGNTYTISSTLTLSKPVHIMGGGHTSPLSTGLAPTVVNCAGTGPAISIPTSQASQSVIEGFNLENTGTCSIGVDLESSLDADVSGVTIRDMHIGGFTAAGVSVGGSTTAHLTINTRLEEVYASGNGINFLIGLSADTTLDHVQGLNYGTVDVQVGDATKTAYRLNITDNSDLEPNNIVNATVIQVLNAESLLVSGCYFEQDGTGYTIDVPATATKAQGIVVTGSRLRSGGAGNNSSFAFRNALAGSSWTIIGNYFTAYAASANIMQNTASGQFAMFGNVSDSTVTSLTSASASGQLNEAGNILAGAQVGPQFETTTANPFILRGTGGFGVGIPADGSGFKHKRFGATCTTGSTTGNTCTTTFSWTTAFADANYTPVCTPVGPTQLGIFSINSFNASGVTILIDTATNAGASYSGVDCVAVHD